MTISGTHDYRCEPRRASRAIAAGLAILLAALLPLRSVPAQTASAADIDDRVAQALGFTSQTLSGKVLNAGLTFHWIGQGSRFWFRKAVAGGGDMFISVEAATGSQVPLFDTQAMAQALVSAGAPASSGVPRIVDASVAEDGRTIVIAVAKPDAACRWPQLYDKCELATQHYRCDLPAPACVALPDLPGADTLLSPDGRFEVHVRKHNLWLRDLRGGEERRLTSDGVAGFAYGEMHDQIETFAASRRRIGLPDPLLGIRWSPDGRYLIALRHDVRPFGKRLVLTEYLPPEGGAPVVHEKREAAADDAVYPAAALSVISVADGAIRQVDLDPHLFEDVAGRYFNAVHFGNGGPMTWDMDRRKLWLIGAKRGGKELRLIEVDLPTGKARSVVTERGLVPISLHPGGGSPNIAVLPKSRRFIWYSERDGWGHLYLYDLDSGKLLTQLTKGAWAVADLIRADEERGIVFFAANGKERGNPYNRYLYSVSLRGGTPKLLTPENADHALVAGSGSDGSISPIGDYLIDDYSTVSLADHFVLRRVDGSLVGEIATADISALAATGWKPPEPVTVKAADGRTDLYGVIYKPRNFDPARRYPVIEITYPGTWSKYAPNNFRGVFYGSAVMNAYAFAELGAIVVSVDGRGTSYRSAEFRNHYYGKDDATGAEDHVAAIRGLAATRPFMDLSRVGVTGHSSGGDGSLRAAMLYPDFFKVVVSGEGPTDYLTLPMDVAIERPLGVPDTPEIRAYYERIATRNMVSRLTPANKVLVIYAGADEQVPLQQGFQIFRAFQSAGFVYDELIVPDAGHWGGRHPYGVMRTARYFAENLGGPQ
ncbi:prolyl oligopeptidase family serine peptidase [Sphingomonas sp. AP4-R1]|uniref:S9 family peptidase n=1 Tax=Sphingomonas sp. AP4-R1 TaxID=2735134 RepID=UPI00149399E7|nr:DPP IV N-terminal domain-containing protein [Sphingomonas sp. AP4-R1]QJU58291.1 prolyl oligopeptidase family serine peptidase [Sphingomonas sp. AP4-R1]